MAAFIYFPVRFMLGGLVTGTTASDQVLMNFVPLVFAVILIGVIIFAAKG